MTEYRLERAALRANRRPPHECGDPVRGMFYGVILVAPFWFVAIALLVRS